MANLSPGQMGRIVSTLLPWVSLARAGPVADLSPGHLMGRGLWPTCPPWSVYLMGQTWVGGDYPFGGAVRRVGSSSRLTALRRTRRLKRAPKKHSSAFSLCGSRTSPLKNSQDATRRCRAADQMRPQSGL